MKGKRRSNVRVWSSAGDTKAGHRYAGARRVINAVVDIVGILR